MNITQDINFFTIYKNETLDMEITVKENDVPLDISPFTGKFVIDKNLYGVGLTLTFTAFKDPNPSTGKFYVKIDKSVLSTLQSGRYFFSLRLRHNNNDDVYYAAHGSFFLKEARGE